MQAADIKIVEIFTENVHKQWTQTLREVFWMDRASSKGESPTQEQIWLKRFQNNPDHILRTFVEYYGLLKRLHSTALFQSWPTPSIFAIFESGLFFKVMGPLQIWHLESWKRHQTILLKKLVQKVLALFKSVKLWQRYN